MFRERTDIKLSGLDNAGNSAPFLHGLERFPASVKLFLGSERNPNLFCWPLNLKGTRLSFESFFPFLLPKP
ncbi:hypothetical protein NC651_015234 [Populus alba x Populus x berolinensis]|nr:hypothetical protein NC651_015234 [Populus alba x Populus x berolinensis]